MNVTPRIAAVLLAGGLLAAPAAMIGQYGPPPPPPGGGYAQGPGGWDAPPNEYRQGLQQDAFRQGLDGARKDFENHRRPDVRNRDEFRNYRGPNRRLYRDAFSRGYNAWWSHQGGRGRY